MLLKFLDSFSIFFVFINILFVFRVFTLFGALFSKKRFLLGFFLKSLLCLGSYSYSRYRLHVVAVEVLLKVEVRELLTVR
jgi:hypothetical protein